MQTRHIKCGATLAGLRARLRDAGVACSASRPKIRLGLPDKSANKNVGSGGGAAAEIRMYQAPR